MAPGILRLEDSLVDKGETRIKFRSDSKFGKMNFQAIDEVKKPLASAAKIANKGSLEC